MAKKKPTDPFDFEKKLNLSLHERTLLNKSCMEFFKTHLRNWTEEDFRTVVDNNFGAPQYFEWADEAEKLIDPHGKKNKYTLANLLWFRFRDECVDYITGTKTFD